jgi:spore maturation protein CgeB
MKKQVCIIHKGGRVHTWGEDLQQGFIELGYEAALLALRDRSPEERRIEKKQKLRYWRNPATIQRIAKAIHASQPSLIIFLNSIGLPEQVHTALKKAAQGVPMVSWLADHVLDIPAECLPNLDAVYSFDSATLPLLEKFYQNTETKLSHLPLAVNSARFQDHSVSCQQRHSQLVFVGNHTPDRKEAIRNLRALGVKVACYGPRAENGWQVWKRRHVNPAATAQLYGAHRAVLNMLQFPNTIHGVNLRAYEIPACGGIGTYPLTLDLPLSFEPHEEIIAYRDLPDLAVQIEALTPDKMKNLLKKSQNRVRTEHTYAHRASHFIALGFNTELQRIGIGWIRA